MNENDKKMMDILMNDKSKRYLVVIDNDCVSVDDTEKEESIHTFEQFGYEFILELFNYLGVPADMC